VYWLLEGCQYSILLAFASITGKYWKYWPGTYGCQYTRSVLKNTQSYHPPKKCEKIENLSFASTTNIGWALPVQYTGNTVFQYTSLPFGVFACPSVWFSCMIPGLYEVIQYTLPLQFANTKCLWYFRRT